MRLIAVIAAALPAVLAAGAAQASLLLRVDSSYISSVARTDTAADPGVIMFSARPNSRTLVKVDVLGDPVLTSNEGYTVDMSGLVAASTAGTITFSMSQTNLNPLSNFVGFDSAAGGTLSTGASVSYQSYLDANDGPFGKGTLLASCSMTASAGNHAFSCDANTSRALTSAYSISQFLTFTLPSGGTASFDATVIDLAEPASASLLALGMVGIGALSRRRVAPTQAV